MKSILHLFLALILGAALFKLGIEYGKSSSKETSVEPALEGAKPVFHFPQVNLDEDTLEAGFDVLAEIQPESKLSKRQRRLSHDDRRRAKKTSSKGGSKGSEECPPGYALAKGSKGGSKGSKGGSKGDGSANCVVISSPEIQPVGIAPLAPVVAPQAAPVTVPFTVPITAPNSPPFASPVAVTISYPSSKGYSKGGGSKGSPTATAPVLSPTFGTAVPASMTGGSSAPVAGFGTPAAGGTTAPAAGGSGSIYVEATAEDCQAITNGQLVQGQNAMDRSTFTFSFDLLLNNGSTNMPTVIATAKAVLNALVAQGIVRCGGSSKGKGGKSGSRRRLQKRGRGLVHHQHRHHKNRLHRRHTMQRRLALDPNVIANVVWDVLHCVMTSESSATCTGTVQVFLKGPASIEDLLAELLAFLENPAFVHDSDLNEIASSLSNAQINPLDDFEAPTAESDAGSRGDPHFTSWKGEHFEFHGQCDLVLAKDPTFEDGLGLDVQIRTKLVRYWSYIKTAAIRIGDDILEVEGSSDVDGASPNFWINFDYQAKSKTIGGFPLAIYDDKARPFPKRRFEIDFDSKFSGQKIVIATYKEFVKVDFASLSAEVAGNSIGMLGDFNTGLTYARDHSTVIHDFNELGLEWQVRPADDMMIFHDISHPQFPQPCLLPEDPQGNRRRRMEESIISMEEAESACATLKDPLSIKDCVYDIMATQDLDMVGAY